MASALRLEWLLQGVLEIQSLITEANFDLDTFMQRIVNVAESLTGACGAVVELVEGAEMVYRAASTAIQQHVGLRLRRHGSLSGLCVEQRSVLRCDDTETDERVDLLACRQVGVRSMICVPLVQNGEAVGVLKVMAVEPGAFDSDDHYLLSLLAGTLGAALGRQLALDALRSSEETFRSAMETSSIGMALIKPNGQFLKVNPALCRLLGYEAAELLASDVQSITHPEDLDRDHELIQRLLSGELQQYRAEKRYYHQSGHIVRGQISVALVRDNARRPRHFVCHIQDLTEQQREPTTAALWGLRE
jgi:PAS domain S-box-containing protein